MIHRDLINYFIIRFSGLFDSRYYLKNNRDVRQADLDPLWHFVKFGWKEGRNPSKDFDTRYYLETNLDVETAGINPFVHYLRYGKFEGRKPYSNFNESKHQESSQFQINHGNNKAKAFKFSENNDVWLDEEALGLISDYFD